MGQCIRGKFTEAGLFPPAPVTEVAETTQPAATPPAETPAAPAAPEGELTPPALDVTPPAETTPEVPQSIVAATFGLLRAEPDGSVVIAGSGQPGSEVDIYSDDKLLGTAKVESSGDWVFVPESPLPPGGVEITLAEHGKSERAAQSFVVVVDDDKTTQPLVVASTPGQASEILQGLDRPAPTAVAAAPEQATPAAAPETEPAPMAVAEAPATIPPAASPNAAPTEPAASAPTATPQETPAAPTPPTVTPLAQNAPAASPSNAPAESTVEPTEPATEPAQTAETQPAPATTPANPATPTPSAAPAATEPAESTPTAPFAPQVADVPPTIDAIEVEGARTFFAGSGPEGRTVRLYVDDTFVADSKVEGGRWLVEAGPVLSAPSQRVRADLLGANSSEVVARAEVDFVVDEPAGQGAETAIASADTPATTTPPAPTPATEPATPATEPATATTSTPTAETPAAEPTAPAAVASAETKPTSAPATTTEPRATTPETSVATAETPAPAPAQPAAEPAVPTMVAVSVGGPDAQRFASGKAIIRRGDNLWTIARRVYGEGIKYTTIYDANTGQIRDPDRIYPGQVFSLPQ